MPSSREKTTADIEDIPQSEREEIEGVLYTLLKHTVSAVTASESSTSADGKKLERTVEMVESFSVAQAEPSVQLFRDYSVGIKVVEYMFCKQNRVSVPQHLFLNQVILKTFKNSDI